MYPYIRVTNFGLINPLPVITVIKIVSLLSFEPPTKGFQSTTFWVLFSKTFEGTPDCEQFNEGIINNQIVAAHQGSESCTADISSATLVSFFKNYLFIVEKGRSNMKSL